MPEDAETTTARAAVGHRERLVAAPCVRTARG
jgi:hypothetical protein